MKIAIREEGNFVVAYVDHDGDRRELATISVHVCRANRANFDAFVEMAKGVLARMAKDVADVSVQGWEHMRPEASN